VSTPDRAEATAIHVGIMSECAAGCTSLRLLPANQLRECTGLSEILPISLQGTLEKKVSHHTGFRKTF
jgi:hypothetical protein